MKYRQLVGMAPLLLVLVCSADTSNPDDVAREFMDHVQKSEFDMAVLHVLPEDRSEFESLEEELSAMPPLPKKIEVVVEVSGNRGQFTIPNWSDQVRVDLVFSDDRWWISE